MIERDLAVLGAIGTLENHLHALGNLEARLKQVPLWTPAYALAKQAQEAQRMINQMQARMERRLVVTLIGPSGSGKSTLLNALAGVDDLSPAGHHRPTTQTLVVLANDQEAVRQLFDGAHDEKVQTRGSTKAEVLTHLVLVDTPDTDSNARDVHWPLIENAVARSDVLICVFDGQNPKRRDHADFMAPLVQRFHGTSLVAVVNQCDRLDPRELTDVIIPEFENYLKQAWDNAPHKILATSARRHLQNPRWDPQAQPRHAIDHFEQLRTLIYNTFNQPGFGPDRRLANARQLVEYMMAQVRQRVGQDRSSLTEAAQMMDHTEHEALVQAVESLRAGDQRLVLGVNVRVYQALAQRWTGPVGWLVALWSRMLLFGTGIVALMRIGNPVRAIWGVISTWRRYKESSAALESLGDQNRVDRAVQAYQRIWWSGWPDIAERLVQGDFDGQVRRMDLGHNPETGTLVRDLWANALDAEIERYAKGLSHFLLQALFNIPCLALLAYGGWLTTSRFLTGQYLTGDFFLHALLSLAMVLLLSFFALQIIVRMAVSRNRIQKRTLQNVQKSIDHQPLAAGREVAEQVKQVIALGD